jgi:aspartate/methionine/tyrosine aminotransferase
VLWRQFVPDTAGCDNQGVIEAAVRAAAVPPFHAMAMSREAVALEADGRRVLHLEVGQPATALPVVARDAVRAHLDDPLGYTNANGLHRLRERLADRERVTLDRIVVVAGASAGFTLAFLTMFEPGDRVGVLEPGYPCYRNTLLALGMTPVPIPVGPDSRWAPTEDHLERAGALAGLVLASPSNPTGTVLTASALDEIAAACGRQGITVIGDEIYHGIVDAPAARMLDHVPDALVVNSFSKYWSMTGWRVGWMVVPEAVVDTVERLQQNLYICAPHVSQVAALAALDATEELDGHVERYRTNRRVLIDGLAAAGIGEIAPADGAFYVYAHVPHLTTALGIESLQLTRRWLHEAGVAATSGVDFDLARGHEYVRFSYAGATADMAEACDLLARWHP